MAIFRATGSRKTSNSSITRKGVSRLSPIARRRDRVAKLRSPPLKALTSFVWLCASVLLLSKEVGDDAERDKQMSDDRHERVEILGQLTF